MGLELVVRKHGNQPLAILKVSVSSSSACGFRTAAEAYKGLMYRIFTRTNRTSLLLTYTF